MTSEVATFDGNSMDMKNTEIFSIDGLYMRLMSISLEEGNPYRQDSFI